MRDEGRLDVSRSFFWQRWLPAPGMIIPLFGAALALLYLAPLSDIFRTQINPVLGAAGELTGEALPFQQYP